MRLSCSLQRKDDGNAEQGWGLRAGCFGHCPGAEGTVDWDGWLRTHCVTAVSLCPQAAWGTSRTQEPAKPRAESACAVVWDTHTEIQHHPWLEQQQQLLTGNGIHSPWTGGSTAAFSSFRAVLSFPHSWVKKRKGNHLGIWDCSMQSLIWRNQLEWLQLCYSPRLPKGGTAQASTRQKGIPKAPSVSHCDTQTSPLRLFQEFLLTPNVWKQYLHRQESVISVPVWFSIRGSSHRIWAGFHLLVALVIFSSAVSFCTC